MGKIKEDSDEWFLAKDVDLGLKKQSLSIVQSQIRCWCPPAKSWLKCNVRTTREKDKGFGGVA